MRKAPANSDSLMDLRERAANPPARQFTRRPELQRPRVSLARTRSWQIQTSAELEDPLTPQRSAFTEPRARSAEQKSPACRVKHSARHAQNSASHSSCSGRAPQGSPAESVTTTLEARPHSAAAPASRCHVKAPKSVHAAINNRRCRLKPRPSSPRRQHQHRLRSTSASACGSG